MKRILFLQITFALLVTSCLAQKLATTQQLSDLDKRQIVLSIFNKNAFGEPNLHISEESNTAYISTENMPVNLTERLRRIKGVKVIFVAPDGLEEKARNTFDYQAFSEFEIKGKKVLVSISYSYADTNSSTLVYEYKKFKGRWQGKLTDWSATANDN